MGQRPASGEGGGGSGRGRRARPPPDLQEGLRPFFTTKPGGLGLGLPLALKIVRLHNGELDLAARQPAGLVVTVRIPETLEGAPSVTDGSVGGGERCG